VTVEDRHDPRPLDRRHQNSTPERLALLVAQELVSEALLDFSKRFSAGTRGRGSRIIRVSTAIFLRRLLAVGRVPGRSNTRKAISFLHAHSLAFLTVFV
jgi:hypothetical protein